MKFHHIGHITRSISRTSEIYEALGFELIGSEILDPVLGVRLQFARNEHVLLEFVQPLPGEKALLGTLGRRSGAYHYAFEYVGDEAARDDWAKRNRMVQVVKDTPAAAFPGRQVSFFVARDGSLLELIR